MKKSLVLAMAMALGVTASAYAANPFSDVPAGHWAYDSVNKLVAAGVVDGYPDGTYGGDKLMTRYEMAQIVAKAMAKGADVDKLAAEFADELDTLGVRVANLEKKADNVKITGEVRYRYVDQEAESNGYYRYGHNDFARGDSASNHVSDIRSRIWVTGQINDDWSYTGMLENIQNLNDDNGNEDVDFQRAYIQGKLGGVDVTAGRYNMFLADGNIYDDRVDGVELSYGSKVKVTAFAGKGSGEFDTYTKGGEEYEENFAGSYVGGTVKAEVAKGLNLSAGYVDYKDIHELNSEENGIDNAIWFAGAAYTVGDVTLSGMYLKGDMDDSEGALASVGVSDVDERFDDDGYVIGLSYKGANADEVGSWGVWAKYYDQGAQTYLAHTTDANTFFGTGFKGYGVAANYTFAKNIVGTVAYYDTESKVNNNYDDQRLWADLTFTF